MTARDGNLSRDQSAAPRQKLLVSGRLAWGKSKTGLIEVRRGMAAVDKEGREAGVVAAVVVDCACQEITHVLLGQLPLTADYRLLPLSLIGKIDEQTLWLSIAGAAIDGLPLHRPD